MSDLLLNLGSVDLGSWVAGSLVFIISAFMLYVLVPTAREVEERAQAQRKVEAREAEARRQRQEAEAQRKAEAEARQRAEAEAAMRPAPHFSTPIYSRGSSDGAMLSTPRRR